MIDYMMLLLGVLLVLFTIALVILIIAVRVMWVTSNYFVTRQDEMQAQLDGIKSDIQKVQSFAEIFDKASALTEARNVAQARKELDEIIAATPPVKPTNDDASAKKKAAEAQGSQERPSGRTPDSVPGV